MRIADTLAARGIIGDTDVPEIVIMVVLCAIGLAVCIPVVKKNVVAKALPVPVPKRAEDFCMSAAPIYFLITALMYFFTDDACLVQLIKNPSSLLNVTRDSGVILALLMLASFIPFYVLYLAASKKSKKI